MNELERRALLGDRQAQEECTRQGIVLPCPCCGGRAEPQSSYAGAYVVKCELCGCSTLYAKGLRFVFGKWNTRTAPPIGRCKDCKYSPYARVETGGFVYCPQSEMQIENENAFCSSFEPRE